jgi:hypothetical protein
VLVTACATSSSCSRPGIVPNRLRGWQQCARVFAQM